RLAGPHDKNLHAEALCRLLNVLRLILCIWICRVDQDCDWRGARNHFMQQPEPLGTQPGGEHTYASGVATRPIEAGDEAYSDRAAPGREVNWNGRSCRFGGTRRDGAACSSQHGYAPFNQFRHQRGQSINLIKSVAIFDRDVSALDKTGFTKTAPERRNE